MVSEIGNILLQKGFCEGHRLGIGHIDGSDGTAIIQIVVPGQRLSRMQYRIHMSRCVDQRDDGDVLFFGVGDDAIHLRLGQLAAACHGVGVIPRLDGILYRIAGKTVLTASRRSCFRSGCGHFLCGGFLLHQADGGLLLFSFDGRRFDAVFQRHVVQQEAQAVVADRQFQIVVTVLCHFVDDVLDLLLRKILSAAVQMEDPHRLSLPSAARRKSGCGKQAQRHDKAEQDCNQSFQFHWFSSLSLLSVRCGTPGGEFTEGYSHCGENTVSMMKPPFPPARRRKIL